MDTLLWLEQRLSEVCERLAVEPPILRHEGTGRKQFAAGDESDILVTLYDNGTVQIQGPGARSELAQKLKVLMSEGKPAKLHHSSGPQLLLLPSAFFPELFDTLLQLPGTRCEEREYLTELRSTQGWIVTAYKSGKLVFGGARIVDVLEVVHNLQCSWFESCVRRPKLDAKDVLVAALANDEVAVDVAGTGVWDAKFQDGSTLRCDGTKLSTTGDESAKWLASRTAPPPWYARSGVVCSAIPENERLREAGGLYETKDLLKGARGLFERIVQSETFRSLDTREQCSGNDLAAWLRSLRDEASRVCISHSDNVLKDMLCRGLPLAPCQDSLFRVTHALSAFLESST